MSRAKELGCYFFRRSSFKMPNSVQFQNEQVLISFPQGEKGVKYAFLDIFLDDVYNILSLKNINSVLDIGAHIGFFSLAIHKRFPNAIVHAYEPNPELAPYLNKNLSQTNVTSYNEGIGLSEGKLSLNLAQDSVCTTSHESATGNITQTAFSMAIERLGGHVDLVKMDCEGAEWSFLVDHTAWLKVKQLHMEFHLFEKDHKLDALIKQVESLGFIVAFVRPEGSSGILYAYR